VNAGPAQLRAEVARSGALSRRQSPQAALPTSGTAAASLHSMQLPLQIACRGFSCSESIDVKVRARVDKLEALFSNITSCRVVIESPHHHQHKGNTYRVSIDLTVPDGEVVVARGGGDNHAHEDVYVAIRDAFDAMGRRLQGLAQRRRGAVKHHDAAAR
jgi:ribosome-associated translation inhibitor RaiA